MRRHPWKRTLLVVRIVVHSITIMVGVFTMINVVLAETDKVKLLLCETFDWSCVHLRMQFLTSRITFTSNGVDQFLACLFTIVTLLFRNRFSRKPFTIGWVACGNLVSRFV